MDTVQAEEQIGDLVAWRCPPLCPQALSKPLVAM